MKANPEYSKAPPELFRFIEAMVNYRPDREWIEGSCRAIFPGLDIYKGHTHWRIFPFGNPAPERGTNVYIDL